MNYDIPGWMSNRDLEVLHYLASCVPNKGSILELGPFLGRSTSAFLTGKKDDVTLDVIDTFTGIDPNRDYNDLKGNKELFLQMRQLALETGDWEKSFRECQAENISKINVFKCASSKFKITKSYDLTFVDASHKFDDVLFDIKKFFKNKGLIAGDDFVPWWPDVVKAVNMVQHSNYATLVVPRGSKIWILVPINKYWENCIKEII